MPRPLLFVLLSLCLLAHTATGAWAATTMATAGPTPNAHPDAPLPCEARGHTVQGHMAAVDGKHTGLSRLVGGPTPDLDHSHCKSSTCQCLQHCATVLALTTASIFADAEPDADTSHWSLHAGDGRPSPYRPVRPPIG